MSFDLETSSFLKTKTGIVVGKNSLVIGCDDHFAVFDPDNNHGSLYQIDELKKIELVMVYSELVKKEVFGLYALEGYSIIPYTQRIYQNNFLLKGPLSDESGLSAFKMLKLTEDKITDLGSHKGNLALNDINSQVFFEQEESKTVQILALDVLSPISKETICDTDNRDPCETGV